MPAARPADDTFVSAVLPPVRLTTAAGHTSGCPQTSGRRCHSHPGSAGSGRRPTPARPCGTSCRTAGRSDSQAIPSLWHATPRAASQPSLEVPGSRQSPGCQPLRRCSGTEVPSLHRRYTASSVLLNLSDTPNGPACPSRASGWHRTPTAGVSRVALDLLRKHAVAITPVGPQVGSSRSPETCDCGLPLPFAGSAPTLAVSRPSRRSLSLRPACSRSRLKRPFTSEASAVSLPPLPLQLLPAGTTFAGRELHPLKIGAFARRTKGTS